MNSALKITSIIFVSLLVVGGGEAALGIYAFKHIEASYKSKSFFIDKINAKSLQFQITLIAKNPSPFSLIINSYDLDAFINGFKVANIKSNSHKELTAKSSSYLTLPITIDYSKAFPKETAKTIFNHFILKEYDKIVLTLSGKFSGSTIKIPINKNIKIDYSLKEIQELIDSPSNT